jgi:probable rRNA maturation factor
MGIEIANLAEAEIDEPDIMVLTGFLMEQIGMSPKVELSVSFVDEDKMSELHQRWMGLSGPTDVLSFPMDELVEPVPGETISDGILGDIVICQSVAARQAKQAGHTTAAEIDVLLTHGVLHLLGNDHAEPEEAKLMFARQSSLLQSFRERPRG